MGAVISEPHVVQIRDEFITLGQFLKFVGLIGEGWEAKVYLAEEGVLVNGEEEDRRGRKLRDGDVVESRRGEQFLVRAPGG